MFCSVQHKMDAAHNTPTGPVFIALFDQKSGFRATHHTHTRLSIFMFGLSQILFVCCCCFRPVCFQCNTPFPSSLPTFKFDRLSDYFLIFFSFNSLKPESAFRAVCTPCLLTTNLHIWTCILSLFRLKKNEVVIHLNQSVL